MTRNKTLLMDIFSIFFMLMLLMLPRLTFSDLYQPSLDNSSAEIKTAAKNEIRFQKVEEEFFKLKYTQNSPSDTADRITFMDHISNKSPMWCNQHFVSLD
jgi:hypothetical protein